MRTIFNSNNMEKENFAQNIINKIREDKLEPKPRWHFILKNYFLWLFGLLSIIIGSLSVSVLMYLINHSHITINSDSGYLKSVIISLPYFWFLFFSLFVFIVYYNIKHLKKGYKYSPYLIVVASFLMTIILGQALYFSGVAKKIDDVLGVNSGLYQEIFNPSVKHVFNPGQGRLVGVIPTPHNEDLIELVDINGETWALIMSNGYIYRGNMYKQGLVVVHGRAFDNRSFLVRQIRPLGPGNKYFESKMQNSNHCFGPGCRNGQIENR